MERHDEEAPKVHIDPEFMFLKILAQPEFAEVYHKEFLAAAADDPMLVVRAGQEWNGGAFDVFADEFAEILHARAGALNAARRKWSKERFARIMGFIDRNSGNLSLTDSQYGELSLPDEAGHLSVVDDEKHVSG